LAAVAALAPLIAADRPEPTEPAKEARPLRILNGIVAAAIVVVGIALLPVWRPTDPGLGVPEGVLAQAPAGITGAVRESATPGDRLVVPQPWASWFEFAMPDLTVAVDSRVEIFPDEVWDDYFTVIRGGDDWRAVLADWDPSFVIATDDDLRGRLREAGWIELYGDDDGALLGSPAP
jgi:hypothetical protein